MYKSSLNNYNTLKCKIFLGKAIPIHSTSEACIHQAVSLILDTLMLKKSNLWLVAKNPIS